MRQEVVCNVCYNLKFLLLQDSSCTRRALKEFLGTALSYFDAINHELSSAMMAWFEREQTGVK